MFSIFVFWGAEDFQKRRTVEQNVEETQELDSNRVKIVVNGFHCKLFSSIGCVPYLPATSAGVLEIQLLLLQYDRHLTFIELVF